MGLFGDAPSPSMCSFVNSDRFAQTKREDVYIQVVCFPYAGRFSAAAEKPRTTHRRQWGRHPPGPSEKYNHAAHRYHNVIMSTVSGMAARVISMRYQHRLITAVDRQERTALGKCVVAAY
jgi:hypothetical protein